MLNQPSYYEISDSEKTNLKNKFKNYLLNYGPITFKIALQLFDATRWSAVIHELRKEGMPIITVEFPNKKENYCCLFKDAPEDIKAKYPELEDASPQKVIKLLENGYFKHRGTNAEKKVDIKNTPICICPVCKNGKIMLGEVSGKANYYCSSYYSGTPCNFKIYGIYNNAPITQSDVKKLCDGKEITKEMSKNGKSWSQRLIYNFKLNKIEYKNLKLAKEYKCPKCGSSISDSTYSICCSNNCGFKLNKTIAGRILTEKDVDDLMTKGKTGYVSFISKNGKKFSAYLILNEDMTEVKFI